MWKEHELVMIPTDKAESALIFYKYPDVKHLKYVKQYLTQEYLKVVNAISYHLYILSNDEIKEEEFDNLLKQGLYFENRNGDIKIITTNRVKTIGIYKKIIATTDNSLKINLLKGIKHAPENWRNLPQLSDVFIHKFVNEYNKGSVITDVKVEYYFKPDEYRIEYLKINSDNTINIKEIVEETFTKNEVIELVMSLTSTPSDISEESATHMVDYWIKNKK